VPGHGRRDRHVDAELHAARELACDAAAPREAGDAIAERVPVDQVHGFLLKDRCRPMPNTPGISPQRQLGALSEEVATLAHFLASLHALENANDPSSDVS
jgi:hypothetical protein